MRTWWTSCWTSSAPSASTSAPGPRSKPSRKRTTAFRCALLQTESRRSSRPIWSCTPRAASPTSRRSISAPGDTAQKGPPLTPVSAHDAEVVAENLLKGNRRKPDYTGVPSVAFTVPPIAAAGLSEADARRRGLQFRANYKRAPDWFTVRQAAEPVYGFKVLIEEGCQRILGAHLVGPHADEVINIFALAIRKGLTADDLKSTLFAYPTGASDISYML